MRNPFEHPFKTRHLMLQVLRSLCRQLVNPNATVGGRDAPLCLDQVCLEEPLKRRIQRAFSIWSKSLDVRLMCCARAYPCKGWRFNVRRIIISNAPGKRSLCSRFLMDWMCSPDLTQPI